MPPPSQTNWYRVNARVNQTLAHPGGFWRCRACEKIFAGEQLELNPLYPALNEPAWVCPDCGGRVQ
jgi:rubrerythrin